jgi:hypothetical protein
MKSIFEKEIDKEVNKTWKSHPALVMAGFNELLIPNAKLSRKLNSKRFRLIRLR